MKASLGVAVGVALASLALAGCSGTTTVTDACIITGFGAELCGHDAVYFCDEIQADARAHARQDRRTRVQAVRDARSLARQLGRSQVNAVRKARRATRPSPRTAIERRSERNCQDVYRAEREK